MDGKQKTFFDESALDPKATISAFVKCVRLRRAEEAVRWLHLLWNNGYELRRRVQRRILIAGAEDCLTIPAMRHVSAWYNTSARKDFRAAATEVLRITKTCNWYATDAGRLYIRRWREIELQPNPHAKKQQDCLFAVMEHAVSEKNLRDAMSAMDALYRFRYWDRQKLAQLLTRLAAEDGNEPANQLAELYERNYRHLWTDGNYSGQALYSLIAGPIGEVLEPSVTDEQVSRLINSASVWATKDYVVPDWCLDGIHCSGHDARFAGTLKHMAAACDVFEKLGRLDPKDDWSKLP